MSAKPGTLLAAGSCAIAVASYAFLAFEGEARIYRLWYYTPAAALAGAFASSRLHERPHGKLRWAIDVVVAILCLARPLTGQPPVSGHAFFAMHALLTCREPLARLLAGGTLVLTLYAKIVLWHGDSTLWPGLAFGILAGLIWRRAGRPGQAPP